MKVNEEIDIAKCDDGDCSIFEEPANCIQMQSLEDENKKYKDIKPVDIYLSHCETWAKKNLKTLKVPIVEYKFMKEDCKGKVLSK